MVVQAYFDDSYKDVHFVLGGYITNAETLVNFAHDWEELLPFGTLNKENRFHFKMSEMAQNQDRMSRVPHFHFIIAKHQLRPLSTHLNENDLECGVNRIWSINRKLDFSPFDNKHVIAFLMLVKSLHTYRSRFAEVIPADQRVDFVLDEQGESAKMLSVWDEFAFRAKRLLTVPFGARPRFEKDTEFLPLQAADFHAWWVRKWYSDGVYDGEAMKGNKTVEGRFPWKAKPSPYGVSVHLTEDHMVTILLRLLRTNIEDHIAIYDIKAARPI